MNYIYKSKKYGEISLLKVISLMRELNNIIAWLEEAYKLSGNAFDREAIREALKDLKELNQKEDFKGAYKYITDRKLERGKHFIELMKREKDYNWSEFKL